MNNLLVLYPNELVSYFCNFFFFFFGVSSEVLNGENCELLLFFWVFFVVGFVESY